MDNKIGLTYQDIALIEKYGVLSSRSIANTYINFLGHKFRMPVVPANMRCVINFKLAEQLAKNNYFYILHRFYKYSEVLNWLRNKNIFYKSISIGVCEEDYEFIKQLKEENIEIDFITIDVAKAYAVYTKEMVEKIKQNLPTAQIIVGNCFGTRSSIEFLQSLDIQAIKVGIGSGKSCTTYLNTGFMSPMFTFVQEAANYSKVPLILDGGVKFHKDMAIALTAAAKTVHTPMVMVGSLFGACIDSPAELIDGQKYYYGSSSRENDNNRHIEGQLVKLPLNPRTILEELEIMKENLSSSISYAGGKDLTCFKEVDYKIIL